MTGDIPAAARRAFDGHEAFSETGDGYAVETTVFAATVGATSTDESTAYTVTVEVPSLDAATADYVGPAVQTGWFETMERRLEDAPKATRSSVDLESFGVADGDPYLTVSYRFEWANPTRAAAIAKTFVEYVEGTYVESVVPGYEYEPPVADLLSRATSRGDAGTTGSTPL